MANNKHKSRALLAELKDNAGITNADIANCLGVTTRTVIRYAEDLSRLSGGQVLELSHLLGITSTQLFDRIEKI